MRTSVNGRTLFYGSLETARRMAHSFKSIYYAFGYAIIMDAKVGLLFDIIGNPKFVIDQDRLIHHDVVYKNVCARIKFNLLDVIATFSHDMDEKTILDEFEEFKVILKDFHHHLYEKVHPVFTDGTPLSFERFYQEEVITINDESIYPQPRGLYGSEFTIAMCLVKFGTRKDGERFLEFLMNTVGPQQYDELFRPFMDYLFTAKFRDE